MKTYNRRLTEYFGEKLYYYEEVDSTNDVAKKMTEWEHGTVVIAEVQRAGRGTYGRRFHSKAGAGIYMSVVLDVDQWQFKQESLATIYTAVAVCEAIESVTEVSPQVKWVNDVFVNRRKVGGILTEKELGSRKLVIGIGVNLTGQEEDFPEELKGIAGSLELDDPVDEQGAAIIKKIYDILLHPTELPHDNWVLSKYKERLFILDQTVEVRQGNQKFEAMVVDVDPAGRLVVQKDGKQQALSAGEVKIKV